MRRLIASWVGVTIALASTRTAVAQPTPQKKAAADAVYAEGQQSYRAGQYLDAASRFESAYALDPDPAYLFNVAQAYRLGNACAKALAAYRKFLAIVPNPPNLATVQTYVGQAEACANQQAAPAPPAPPVTPAPEGPVDAPSPPPPAPDSGRTQRWLGLGTIVVVGVAVAAGVYFTGRVGHYKTLREGVCEGATINNPCDWSSVAGEAAGYESDGKAASRNAVLSYAVGGAAIIGGVALYMLGRSSGERAAAVTVIPTADGAVAVGAFRF